MIFDILFLTSLGIGFFWGWKNGIIYTFFSLIGWFLGIIAALKFSYLLINLLRGLLDLSPKALAIISFLLVIVLVLLLMKAIAWSLEQILKTFSLNLPNKIIGGVLHALISLYVLCVLIWFLNRLDVISQKQKETSYVYPYIGNLAPKAVEYTGKVIPLFKDAFTQFEDLVK